MVTSKTWRLNASTACSEDAVRNHPYDELASGPWSAGDGRGVRSLEMDVGHVVLPATAPSAEVLAGEAAMTLREGAVVRTLVPLAKAAHAHRDRPL